jgi:hypothetical protein
MLLWILSLFFLSEVHMQRTAALLCTLLVLTASLAAQDSFVSRWGQRASQTQSKQPAWPPPLITTYVGLIEVGRSDFMRQTASNHTQTWNLDGSKGLNLIPFANTEIDTNLPPYLLHSVPTVLNGAGDMSFVLKYRFLAGNANHGSYVLSSFLSGTIPTGSHKNGSTDAAVSPNIGVGKGIRWFDVQSTLGASLPVEDAAKLGRSIAWNTAAQFHVEKYFWPEVELNSTFFKGGANDGKSQVFATPGMLYARKLKPEAPRSRLAICAGAGMQIATSHFHSYNHEIAVTTRFLF